MFAENNNEPANNVFRKIYYIKRKNRRKFLLIINIICIINLECQRPSTQYHLLRIAENKCSTLYITYTEQQKSSAGYDLLGIWQKCSTWYNLLGIARRSHQRCSVITGVLRNFTKFTGKHMCQSLFFNKIAGLRPFSQNTSWRMLLNGRNVLLHISTRNSKNILPRITYSEQQKYSAPYNLLRIARSYSGLHNNKVAKQLFNQFS